MRPGKYPDPHLRIAKASLARIRAGPGIYVPDDGLPGERDVRLASIPFLPTDRLARRAAVLRRTLFTPDGMHAWDDKRRRLVYAGMTLKAIDHELALRASDIP